MRTKFLLSLLLMVIIIFKIPNINANNMSDKIVMKNDYWEITFNPATLKLTAILPNAEIIPITLSQSIKNVKNLKQIDKGYIFELDDKFLVSISLDKDILSISFVAKSKNTLVFPVIPDSYSALILPLKEGLYIKRDDAQWQNSLQNTYNGINTTEDLSLPVVGLQYKEHIISILFENPFNNEIKFLKGTRGSIIENTHEFTSLDFTRPFILQFKLNKKNLLSPAKHYRAWIIKKGEFVSIDSKLKNIKDGQKIIGASHSYIFGSREIKPADIKDWELLLKLVPKDWKLSSEIQKSNPKNLQNNKYLQNLLIEDIHFNLANHFSDKSVDDFQKRQQLIIDIFGKSLFDSNSLGDTPIEIIKIIQSFGLKRMWLGLPDWRQGFANPSTVKAAINAGYLIAPYDSYDTALPPNTNKDWTSANLGDYAYLNCGVMLENGQRKKGFQNQGVYTNQICIKDILKKRILNIQNGVNYNSWFLDVAATGMVFDDYDLKKPTPQSQDAVNRMESANYIAKTLNVVVGSEVGGAVANKTVIFAHGMQLAGFAWEDEDVRKNKKSKYYLGNYYPNHQPTKFFLSVPLKEKYRALYFEPSKRIPLFQAVFHDSVITTYHWEVDSLKFKDQQVFLDILQQLYNVPPLVNLSLETLNNRLSYIKHLDSFFRPLHEQLYNKELENFLWLDDVGQIQQTSFSDGTKLIANFSDKDYIFEKITIPGFSVVAIFKDGKTNLFKAKQY
jgi:hypothetical protein